MSEAVADARCALHVDRTAAVVCDRCGNFACDACAIEREGRDLCLACSRRFLGFGGSWLAVAAAALGFCSLGCAPVAPLAIACAVGDLVAIARGRSPKSGWTLDAIGLVIGTVGAVLWSLVALRMLGDPRYLDDVLYGY